MGEGRESAKAILKNADAAVKDSYYMHAYRYDCFLEDSIPQEAGPSNVSAMTRSLASMCGKKKNFKHADRDIFRYIRMRIVTWLHMHAYT